MRLWHFLRLPYFNSLPHAEVDFLLIYRSGNQFHFNSLPHAEVDEAVQYRTTAQPHFNSLPHAEVDSGMKLLEATMVISTHYLIQR